MHPTAPRTIGQTGITLSPLVFGGNVFGWTADKAASFAMLDRLLDRPQRLLVTVLLVTNLANIFAVTLIAREAVARMGHAGYLLTLAAALDLSAGFSSLDGD